MGYFGELRTNWQPLAAATAGLSAGLSLSAYTNAAMGPQFLAAFGWSRSDFALTGAITLLTFLFLPIYGRLTDLFGVRRIATVGVIGIPACWVAYALMTGPIWQYFAINVVLIVLGVTTTPSIYSRLVATRFRQARGLALAIAISGPPLLGAIGVPVLDVVNRHFGWRATRHDELAAVVFGEADDHFVDGFTLMRPGVPFGGGGQLKVQSVGGAGEGPVDRGLGDVSQSNALNGNLLVVDRVFSIFPPLIRCGDD